MTGRGRDRMLLVQAGRDAKAVAQFISEVLVRLEGGGVVGAESESELAVELESAIGSAAALLRRLDRR